MHDDNDSTRLTERGGAELRKRGDSSVSPSTRMRIPHVEEGVDKSITS